MTNLDIALHESINGNPDVSEALLRAENQDDPRVKFNLGWHELRHGNFTLGFEGMNTGRFIRVFGSPPIPGSIWKDQDLHGKTILFRCEGGLGDQICNLRFAKGFEAKGAKVVVECDSMLAAFFSSQGFACCTDHRAVFYDYWIPAMSAAYILGHTYETLPGNPYLSAKPRELYSLPGELKVGIRWAGNPKFEHEQHRVFDPQPLLDLHTLDGIRLYSLQRDANLVDALPFPDMRDHMKTWTDTAEIIAGLDLVITSCTSIAHLSAALGVPTWVIVPVLPYYVWALPGETSPWYESVTLFRQQRYGSWTDPMRDIKTRLEMFLTDKSCMTLHRVQAA